MKYVLLEVEDDDIVVRELARGTPAQCLLAAAEKMRSVDLHDIRLVQLPDLQRRAAAFEKVRGRAGIAPGPTAMASAN